MTHVGTYERENVERENDVFTQTKNLRTIKNWFDFYALLKKYFFLFRFQLRTWNDAHSIFQSTTG